MNYFLPSSTLCFFFRKGAPFPVRHLLPLVFLSILNRFRLRRLRLATHGAGTAGLHGGHFCFGSLPSRGPLGTGRRPVRGACWRQLSFKLRLCLIRIRLTFQSFQLEIRCSCQWSGGHCWPFHCLSGQRVGGLR